MVHGPLARIHVLLSFTIIRLVACATREDDFDETNKSQHDWSPLAKFSLHDPQFWVRTSSCNTPVDWVEPLTWPDQAWRVLMLLLQPEARSNSIRETCTQTSGIVAEVAWPSWCLVCQSCTSRGLYSPRNVGATVQYECEQRTEPPTYLREDIYKTEAFYFYRQWRPTRALRAHEKHVQYCG